VLKISGDYQGRDWYELSADLVDKGIALLFDLLNGGHLGEEELHLGR